MLINTGSRISLHNVGNYIGQVQIFCCCCANMPISHILPCHIYFYFVLDYYVMWLFLILRLPSWCFWHFMIFWLLSISLVWCNCYITLWFLNCDESIIVISPQGGEPSLHPWLQKQQGENFLHIVKVKVMEAPFWNVLFPNGHCP